MAYTKSIETLKVFVLGIFLFGSSICYSQKEDYNWAVGGYSENYPSEIFGIGYFHFTDDGLELSKGNNVTVMAWTYMIPYAISYPMETASITINTGSYGDLVRLLVFYHLDLDCLKV